MSRETISIIMWVAAAIVLVLYLARRRKRKLM
jgi:MYXO-CTERM domain-containing protein